MLRQAYVLLAECPPLCAVSPGVTSLVWLGSTSVVASHLGIHQQDTHHTQTLVHGGVQDSKGNIKSRNNQIQMPCQL